MSKIADFIGSLARLAEIPHAGRIDRQNVLVFHDELKGGTVFDHHPGEKDRTHVLFRGFPETPKVAHLKGLVRLLELTHYIHENKATDDEVDEAYALAERLSITESAYPDIAATMSVEDAATVASSWI